MKNRIASVLLLGLLVTSCGNGPVNSSEISSVSRDEDFTYYEGATEIRVWAPKIEKEVIADLVNAYNLDAPKDKRVNILFEERNLDDSAKSFVEASEKAEHPDLLQITDKYLTEFKRGSYLSKVPMDSAEALASNSLPLAFPAITILNEVYHYPICADNTPFLWYDSSYFSEEEMGSLESILEKCQASDKAFYMSLNSWYYPSFFLAEGVCGRDSLRFHKNGDGEIEYTVFWDNSAGVSMAKSLAEIVSSSVKAKNWIPGSSGESSAAYFGNGSVIACVDGLWMKEMLEEKCPTIKARKLPTFQNHQLGSFGETRNYVVNGKSSEKEQEAAHIVAGLLSGEKGQLRRLEAYSHVPCNKNVLASKAFQEGQDYATIALAGQLSNASLQSVCVENRYWSIGDEIGYKLKSNDLEGSTWEEFLKSWCDSLRNPAK